MKTVKIPVLALNTTTIILLIVKCLILLVALTFSLVSLGVFADKNSDIENNAIHRDNYCILFLSSTASNNNHIFGSNSICQFVIVGQAAVSFLILTTIVVVILGVIIKKRYCIRNSLYYRKFCFHFQSYYFHYCGFLCCYIGYVDVSGCCYSYISRPE